MNNNIASLIAGYGAIIGLLVFGFNIEKPSATDNQPIEFTPPSKSEQPVKVEEFKPQLTNQLTQEETILLFYALLKECSVCDDAEQRDVIKVFLSRKEDSRFPNTIKEVLNQRGAVHGVNKYDQKVWLRTYNNVLRAAEESRDSEIVGYYYPEKSTNTRWVNKVKGKVEVRHDYHHFHTI